MKSWNEMRKAAMAFSKRWKDAYSRDGRGNATNETSTFDGVDFSIVRTYDAYGRLIGRGTRPACPPGGGELRIENGELRIASSFAYNSRGEVTSAVIGDHDEAHEYDFAGNSITASYNSITNEYIANNLNQYTKFSILNSQFSILHDVDGNLTNCAPWSFTWDSGNRLTTVSSNGVQIASYAYDAFGRRVKKTTATATTHFFYDGWNLVREVEICGAETNVVEYVWGKDLSGTFQGAGGVGGLLYEKRNGAIYIPYQDAFGNVMGYWDTNGVIVAEYTYDAFGRTISQFGPMAEVFRHRFSTKYYDSETGFYYYGYRYYFPELRRWLSRDPLEEEGGANLYAFSANSPIYNIDFLGGKIVVIKHIPGEEPLGGWSNSGALADTVYKSTSYITAEYKCAEGKIGFKVQIIELVVMVHVYMTKKVDPLFLMHFENDHVHNAKRHDAAIWKYKYDLESVCVCPCEARRRQQELEQSLVDITRKIKEDNDTLDSENGPHKIDWVPGVKR